MLNTYFLNEYMNDLMDEKAGKASGEEGDSWVQDRARAVQRIWFVAF